jgi:hypothetical protein
MFIVCNAKLLVTEICFGERQGSNSKAGRGGSGAGPAWPTRTVPLPGSQSITAPHRTAPHAIVTKGKTAEPSPPSARSAGHASRPPSTPARHLESIPNLPYVLSALPHQRPPRLPSSTRPRRVVDPSGPVGKRWLCLYCSCSIRFFCLERYSNACS